MTQDVVRAVTISTTVDDPVERDRIATTVVEERLAACVQVTPDVHSTYRWKGRIEHTREWSLVFKTTTERVEALLSRLRSLHPYETPELLVTPLIGGDPDYLAWMAESTTPPEPASS